MKSVTPLISIMAALASALAVPSPDNAVGFPIDKRVEGAGDGIVALVMLIESLIDADHNAYDTDIGHQCVIYTETTSGSNCRAYVSCGGYEAGYGSTNGEAATLQPDGGSSWDDTWNTCYLNGRQYMTHPSVGDFSITFTEAGGVNSDRDGLHNPVMQFAHVDQPIDAQADADKDESSGHICGTREVAGTQLISYYCGIPQIGYSNFGLTNTPALQSSYAPGQCGIHFIQYQIPDGGNHYSLALRIVDANGALIGQVGNSYEVGGDNVDATNPVDVDSALPYVVIATVVQPGSFPDTDDQPVKFAYAGQSWDSSSSQCSTGSYDSGSRQGDCGFTC